MPVYEVGIKAVIRASTEEEAIDHFWNEMEYIQENLTIEELEEIEE